MNKIVLSVAVLFLLSCGQAFAGGQVTIVTPDGTPFGTANNPITVNGALVATSIVDVQTTYSRCRAVWVGTTQSIDLYVNGSWITFQGATAGSIIPVYATGARKTSGAAAPSAGDIVFLY